MGWRVCPWALLGLCQYLHALRFQHLQKWDRSTADESKRSSSDSSYWRPKVWTDCIDAWAQFSNRRIVTPPRHLQEAEALKNGILSCWCNFLNTKARISFVNVSAQLAPSDYYTRRYLNWAVWCPSAPLPSTFSKRQLHLTMHPCPSSTTALVGRTSQS